MFLLSFSHYLSVNGPLQIYNLETVAEQCELPGGFVVGAGAGPAHVLGVNAEVLTEVEPQENSLFLTFANNSRPDQSDFIEI